MKIIDLETWPRRKHFELFRGMDNPHFNITANVDITATRTWVKDRGGSLFRSILYIAARVANEIPEFQLRIRGEQVVAHAATHPSFTVLGPDDLFGFCMVEYDPDARAFFRAVETAVAQSRQHPSLDDEPGRDDFLYVTCVPWVAFTGVSHPIHYHPIDSFPRIAWGKYFAQNSRHWMPLSVQAHHGLMDGLHAGRYFENFQTLLDHPGEFHPA